MPSQKKGLSSRSNRSRVAIQKKPEKHGVPNLDNLELIVKQLLENLGESPNRHGLHDTPRRVAKSLVYFTKGYQQDIDELLNGALFPI